MKVIEQDTINFIKAHINERPRYKLAQRMGVSVKFLYKILHDCNCKIEHKRPVPQPDKKRDEQITKLYPDHSVREIAVIVGCHPSTVGKAAKRLKLTHSEETIERLKKNSLANLKKAYDKATIGKRVEKLAKNYADGEIPSYILYSAADEIQIFRNADKIISCQVPSYK